MNRTASLRRTARQASVTGLGRPQERVGMRRLLGQAVFISTYLSMGFPAVLTSSARLSSIDHFETPRTRKAISSRKAVLFVTLQVESQLQQVKRIMSKNLLPTQTACAL